MSGELMQFIESPPAYLLSACTFCGGVLALFGRIEKLLSPDARKGISAWLRKTDRGNGLTRWPKIFGQLLDLYFGPNHWTVGCFLRSALLSITFMVGVTLLARAFSESVEFMVRENLRALGVGFAALVLTADFLSIGKARWVIKRMAMSNSNAAILGWAVLDAIASVALVYVMLFILELIFWATMERHTMAVVLDSMVASFRGLLLPFGSQSLDTWFGVFVYSSLFTSLWAGLFALVSVGIRAADQVQRVQALVVKYTNVDEQPLTLIALAAVGVFLLIFTAGALVHVMV